MLEIGFTENSVIKANRVCGGSLIIYLNGNRYALGKGMAKKIGSPLKTGNIIVMRILIPTQQK
ncbi:FeoA domain-containing protein [Methanococcoides burtonii]|uniref:Ferrous iron transporter FeoA-like domain-containing protein n=1 Tax=Methanococcoides burtonii (strain DSM 6242 / NBRC 107633 / OCM 468 / ACE-M) TaxID=259564 RepID=Q12XU5_METBU|nr:FeoA domain-containing protein [Methanococcoides burtonii]ABE51731.1 Hypothetical protein Mbur_0775 [Methanococcoides burtonii DSM 6242]